MSGRSLYCFNCDPRRGSERCAACRRHRCRWSVAAKAAAETSVTAAVRVSMTFLLVRVRAVTRPSAGGYPHHYLRHRHHATAAAAAAAVAIGGPWLS